MHFIINVYKLNELKWNTLLKQSVFTVYADIERLCAWHTQIV